jgi:mycothiol synthase
MIATVLPRGFTLSPLKMDDLEAVTGLVNTCEVALDGEEETTVADIRTAWQSPSFNLETDSWQVRSSEGKLVAALEVHNRHYVKIYTDGCVHPEYRGRGIGSQLLRLAEERARQFVSLAPAEARVTLSASFNAKDQQAQALLENHGLAHVRSFWRMGIHLNEMPGPASWPEGIEVRTMTPAMVYRLYEADEEAFRDHWGYIAGTFEEWKHWTLEREGYDPSLWFLAMDGEEIAGFALCQDEKQQGGWVHVLGVRRSWRRKGIGLALLRLAFAEFYLRGIQDIYLGVDAESLTGATRLYERAGMHAVKEYKRYEKELRAGKELTTQFVGE